MSRFLVYIEQTYYPWAEIVEADSAEQAPDALEYGRVESADAYAVCPIEHVTFIGDASRIEGRSS